ncbi:hypothetical protein EJ04DRAFT_299319 [Polyplosphaeria fusca]|uniref:Uncharacterized protein n=1 Tax=Polyplosphaeria fusca TaxID=682080 RepID=A0A9P4QUZ0_9PLEO|nr:hypothetical protein EJ04DRAFT_299319 [Polyplosphaeria fusca]
MSDQNSFQQPIAAVTTSAETAYAAGDGTQQTKARFTRAERRAFTKEKKAAETSKKPRNKNNTLKDTKGASHGVIEIDDIIAALISIRGSKGNDHKARQSINNISRSLQDRITRDVPKKAAPSAEKLEKIEKRKAARAEKRKAWKAQKEAEAQDIQPQPTEDASKIEKQDLDDDFSFLDE